MSLSCTVSATDYSAYQKKNSEMLVENRQFESTLEASDHIYFSQRPVINVKGILCA